MDSITTNILKQCDEHVIKVLQTPNQEKTDFTKALEIIVEETRSQSVGLLKICEQIFFLDFPNYRPGRPVRTVRPYYGHFEHPGQWFDIDRNTDFCFGWRELVVCHIAGESDRNKDRDRLTFQGTTKLHVKKKMLTGKCGIVPFCQKQSLVTLKGFKWNVGELAEPETEPRCIVIQILFLNTVIIFQKTRK